MSRKHQAATPGSVVLSGTLGEAIRGHMKERIRHFFLFLYTHRMILLRLNGAYARGLAWGYGVRSTATHQVDSGTRSADLVAYGAFGNADPNVLNHHATAFGRMDAAHYCNLGIEPAVAALCNTAATDRILFGLHEQLKAVCGNTRQMPQRINIGPDRAIDRVHAALAPLMLNGTPPVTRANMGVYIARAIADLTTYQTEQARLGNAGVAACVNAYLAVLNDAAEMEDVWLTIFGNAAADCSALGFAPGDVIVP